MKSLILDDFTVSKSYHWDGDLARGAGCFPDARDAGLISGNITTCELPEDWSGFTTLQFTLFNPWSQAVVGGIDIYDEVSLSSPELEYGDYAKKDRSLLISPGVSHVVIMIDPLMTTQGNRSMDLTKIRKLTIRVPQPPEGMVPISISDLRLSGATGDNFKYKNNEKIYIDDLANSKPGDSILIVDYLDVKCFTFQPERYKDQEDVLELIEELRREKNRLQDAVNIAEINGKQTLYAQAALIAADIALIGRPMLAWHFSPKSKRANLNDALELVREERIKLEKLLNSRIFEDDEDDSNLPLSLVKPVPDIRNLRISGNRFVDPAGNTALICAMNYHNEGALLKFFSPENHKRELYAVGGGSRYDIEWSPVYKAFKENPGTVRVGWRGWCGHLIKDQWSMGGRKENVVLCLENQKILDAIDEYNRIHAKEWVNDPSLLYVILAYELTYMCYCDESLRRFRLWLEEKHGSIEALNSNWNTEYRDFSEVIPPPTEGQGPTSDVNRAAWFDWANWNTRRFTDHLKWSRKSVRKLHPDIPICAGGTHSMLSTSNSTSGIDEELIINEVDDVILHEGNDLLGIDLLNALAETPKPMVDPEQGGGCRRWLLNYLHGKSTIAMFWWPKQPSRQFPSSTLASPFHGNMSIKKVAEHLTTALDVRRLSEELTAFWDIKKEAAILYSKTNMLQVDPELIGTNTTPYLTALRESYEAARCLDTGLTFISEKQLLKGKGDKFKLIILPAATYMSREVFSAIDGYVKAGGNLLVLPESLLMNEYTHQMNYLETWGIHIASTHKENIEGFGDLQQKYDQNLERQVKFGGGKVVSAAKFSDEVEPFELTISGLFQEIQADKGKVLISAIDDTPILTKIARGSGYIWYLAGMPERESLLNLLDLVYAKSGIERRFRVTDKDGSRVPGLEARMVSREHDDLIYLANESGREIDFIIEKDAESYSSIRELRSLRYYKEPAGTIAEDQVLIFSFQRNPADKYQS